MYLGVDDTDSLQGGCTTHVAWTLASTLPEGIDLIGKPRLVRLNPNVPYRTRGNAALALRLGHGRGYPQEIGMGPRDAIHAFESGTELSAPESDAVFDWASETVHALSRAEDARTQPGLVATRESLPATLYEEAVHRLVARHEALDALAATNARFQGWNGGRGILGAAAALAWPAVEGTFEVLGYRHEAAVGTPRRVGAQLGPRLDEEFPNTFDNWDPVHEHLRVIPNTPCPVLAGIRGTDPRELTEAIHEVGPERPMGWLTFATNQATDDHLRPMGASRLRPFTSARLTLEVDAVPRTQPGGHVFVRASDNGFEVDLAAFEPTKEFRDGLRTLRPGDHILADGAVHQDPSLLGLERLQILDGAPRVTERPPLCAACSIRMKARGRVGGFRCERCRARSMTPERRVVQGPAQGSAFEVPVLARRHLSRPLRLKALATF